MFNWNVFFYYLWPPTAFQNPVIANGFVQTLLIFAVSMALATALGMIIALSQLSRVAPVRWIATGYVGYFRGTPVLVQLYLLYFGIAAVGLYRFPQFEILGLPISGSAQAGILGLGLNGAAYLGEIFRAGIQSVDRGQLEASLSIGMTRKQAMRYIVIPQAIRVIIPPFGNEVSSMIKGTALVIGIGGLELFGAFAQVNGVLFRPFELFFAVSFYYLALTTLWAFAQRALERHLQKPWLAVSATKKMAGTELAEEAK